MKQIIVLLLFAALMPCCDTGDDSRKLVFKASYRSTEDTAHIFLFSDDTFESYTGSASPMGSASIQQGEFVWNDSVITLQHIQTIGKTGSNHFLITSANDKESHSKKILRPLDGKLKTSDTRTLYRIYRNDKDSVR